MSEPVMKEATVVGAYYDDVKKAIVLNAQIDGIKTVFQTPFPPEAWTFPLDCKDKEAEMKKTAELFNERKGMRITLQFDGGQINGSG